MSPFTFFTKLKIIRILAQIFDRMEKYIEGGDSQALFVDMNNLKIRKGRNNGLRFQCRRGI
jgi:hypothetical protein